MGALTGLKCSSSTVKFVTIIPLLKNMYLLLCIYFTLIISAIKMTVYIKFENHIDYCLRLNHKEHKDVGRIAPEKSVLGRVLLR